MTLQIMEVDVIINDRLADNAGKTDELSEDDNCGKRRMLSSNKTYHVFFSYRDVPNDKLWVKEAVTRLENDYGYICCDHDRDFVPGTKIMDNIKSGIKNSEKVVVVLSNEALESEYVQLETEMAHKLSIEKRENILIPVLLDDCEIPEELRLLTYIDARKEINERTWWPKLIAAIESKGGYSFFKGRKEEETKHNTEDKPSFHFKKLCSLGTTFSCTQCSIQSTSKYIPWELVSNEVVVSVETIKNIKKDLLDVPRIRCKQTCCCFVNGCLVLCVILLVLNFVFDIISIIVCAEANSKDCYLGFGCFVVLQISIGICCGFGWKSYLKIPRNLDNKIIEYNTELIKDGILITLVSGRLWKSATIVFFRVSVEKCKKYVIVHLREDIKVEREKFMDISGIQAQYDADDVPLLTGSWNEDPAQPTEKNETLHVREDRNIAMLTFVDTSEMQAKHNADDVPLLTVSGNEDPAQATEKYGTLHLRNDSKVERKTYMDISKIQVNHDADDVPLLTISENEEPAQLTEVDQRNGGHHPMDVDQGSTIVDLSDQDNEPLLISQDSKFAQNSDSSDLENVAMTLLLKYTHEYLRLVLGGKMKNPKQDRHTIDWMCLCQYIEKKDKVFRKIVDRNKIIDLSKEMGTDILDSFRL